MRAVLLFLELCLAQNNCKNLLNQNNTSIIKCNLTGRLFDTSMGY